MNRFILVGLGNPGTEYEFTRHNAGKMFARYLREHPIAGVEAIETECYMNESGSWIAQMLSSKEKGKRKKEKGKHDFLLPSSFIPLPLIVAHDDLDLPLGKFKIQFGRGPRQHKGILSIEGALGTTEFWRVRIGVDARKKEEGKRQREVSGEEYVLQRFSRAERAEVDTLFPQIREQLRILFRSIRSFSSWRIDITV